MNFSNQHQQIALTLLSGIGSRRARIIVSFFNDLDEFFQEKKLDISKLPGIPTNMLSYKHRVAVLEQADSILNELAKLGAGMTFLTDTNYPKRLKQCEDAPLVLYSKGNVEWNARRIISVVGTRKATDYGKHLTDELITGLQNTGAVVVSGMAYGIDIRAHKMAVKLGIPTWAVLGHGLDKLYPSGHARTANQMLEQGGLISEFVPGMKIEPGNFPMRNRIVAGLADATIVVESGASGGSLITANLASDYHRDVFAFPGDVNKPSSAGCLKLIKDNVARLVTSSADVLEALDWEVKGTKKPEQASLFMDLTYSEERIMEVLREKRELNLDAIGYLSTLPVHEVSSFLLNLEFKGLVKSLPGKRFSIC